VEVEGNMRYVTVVRLLAFALLILVIPVASSAQIGIAITIGPPALPIYEQPPCPEEGYIWVPGYWAFDYDFDDYYWVPGTWVLAPEVGFFWTPGYWAWVDDRFVFYDGYWGPEVGFYGGINYGFGYFGDGYVGGRWDNGRFFYNRAVTNVNVTNIRNVYNNTTVINNTTVTRASYNGGNGGVRARPTPQQDAVAHQRHVGPVAAQTQQVQVARSNPQLRAAANQGKPPIAATPRPGALSGGGVVPAKQAGAPYHPAPNRAAGRPPAANGGNQAPGNNPSRPGAIVHPNDIPPRERSAPPATGNPRVDQKYQQEQQKLQAQQDRERQKLQQKQDQEHQRVQQQAADNARMQQLEQKHQQQTQRLQEKHSQQWENMQERQQPHPERRSPPPQ
jgi:hypothetical protein